MIKIEIRHENSNGREFGRGTYVNAYVTWDDDSPETRAVIYASKCVARGQDTPAALKAAEKRVRRQAYRRARSEYEDYQP